MVHIRCCMHCVQPLCDLHGWMGIKQQLNLTSSSFRLGLVVFAIDCIVHRTVSELLTCLLTTCFSPWCGINCERVIGPEMTLWGWRDVKTTTRSPENVFEYDCIDFCWMFLNMIVLTSAGYFWIWLYWLLLGLVRPEVDRTLKSKSNYQLCVCLICIIT